MMTSAPESPRRLHGGDDEEGESLEVNRGRRLANQRLSIRVSVAARQGVGESASQ